MKDLIIIKSSQDLHEIFQEAWIQEYRASNTKLPAFNFPLAMHFDHENKKFELREMSDEKFSFNVANQAEFVELMQHFGAYKPLVDFDASKLNYPVVVYFDAAKKSYDIKQTEIQPEDNSVKPVKKGWFKKNWQWVLIGAVTLIILGTVLYAVLV